MRNRSTYNLMPWSRSRQQESSVPVIVAAMGAGAAVMYFLDPDRGKRRRHLVRDKLVHASHVTGSAAEKTGRDLRNRAQGARSAVRQQLTKDEADDAVLAERVRAELGRAVSHPRAIHVSVQDRRVTLSGPVLARESEALLSRVGRVRGVQGVEDALQRHESSEGIAALQGELETPTSRFEFLQENWTPAARLLATLTGGTLAVLGLRNGQRGNPVAAAAGVAGAAFLVRGLTNMPFRRLTGVGADRQAITVHKSINIAAPVDEVFGWLSAWERWPEWMSHVRQVRAGGGGDEGELTHWVVDGPAGTQVEWDAVTTQLQPPDLIAWKTVDGSAIAHAGRLRLVPTDEGFTRVDVQLSYNPPAGVAGHAVATLFRRDPKRQLDDDMARLKTVIEEGRVPRDAASHTAATAEAIAQPPAQPAAQPATTNDEGASYAAGS